MMIGDQPGCRNDDAWVSSPPDCHCAASELNQYKLAYLHVIDGLGFGYHNKCRAMTLADVRKARKHAAVRRLPDRVVGEKVSLSRLLAANLLLHTHRRCMTTRSWRTAGSTETSLRG